VRDAILSTPAAILYATPMLVLLCVNFFRLHGVYSPQTKKPNWRPLIRYHAPIWPPIFCEPDGRPLETLRKNGGGCDSTMGNAEEGRQVRLRR